MAGKTTHIQNNTKQNVRKYEWQYRAFNSKWQNVTIHIENDFRKQKIIQKESFQASSPNQSWNKHFKGNKADSWRTTRWMPLKYANKKPYKRDQIKSNDDLINVMMKMRPGKCHQPCWMHDFSVRVTSTSHPQAFMHTHSLAHLHLYTCLSKYDDVIYTGINIGLRLKLKKIHFKRSL